jgi:MFS family permease
MRGRVVALLLAITMGGTPLGAPIVGWVADRFGPRYALCLGGAAGLAATLVGFRYLTKYRGLRVSIRAGRPRFGLDGVPAEEGRADAYQLH